MSQKVMPKAAVKREKAIPAKRKSISREVVRVITEKVVYFLVGLLSSRGVIFGTCSPFGGAVIAAVPYKNIGFSIIGSFIGYLLPGSAAAASFRYIAVILAVAAIRWALSDLAKLQQHPLFIPLVAFIPTIVTGFALNLTLGLSIGNVPIMIAEAFLTAGCAFFFGKAASLSYGTKGLSALNQQELACVIISFGSLILALSNVAVLGISIGRIAAIILILLAARFGGVAGGSIGGISTGVFFGLSGEGFTYLAGAYSFSGLMAGIFSPLGKLGTAAAFILCNAMIALQSGDNTNLVNGLYETGIATIVFLLVPTEFGNRISKIFSAPSDIMRTDELRKTVVMKLDFAAKALNEVAEAVEIVSEKLAKINAPNVNTVYDYAMEHTCHACGLRVYCWERERENNLRAIASLSDVLLRDGRVERSSFPSEFIKRCSRAGELINSINRSYDDYLAREAADRRIAEIRSVVADQFNGMGGMLSDLAQEINVFEAYDTVAADRVYDMVNRDGLVPIDVSCRVDHNERMTVEIVTAIEHTGDVNMQVLRREISAVCDRVFDMPVVTSAGGSGRITLSERPSYKLSIGTSQHVCDNGGLCGDSLNYFNDSSGRTVIILADGMGSGGRAAVDGAMASSIMSKLLKAGLSFQCALKIANSALLVKSGDETLATIDVSAIDLFTGKVEILKAGAPVTFICHHRRAETIESPSLPAGILREVEFARKNAAVEKGDILLMISDGVVVDSYDWIIRELERWQDGDAQDLADHIVEEARKRRLGEHDDDITAIAVMVDR